MISSIAITMETLFILVAGLLLFSGLFVTVQYNHLVNLQNLIRNSWNNIDAELKRRYDLIPKLVDTIEAYTEHEAEVLENIIQLRNQCQSNHGPIYQQEVDESLLVNALQRLIVVVEGVPELKASENYLLLREELIDTEDKIQAARNFYNGKVKDYNNKCQLFPSSLISSAFGFRSSEFFEVKPAIHRNPQVGF